MRRTQALALLMLLQAPTKLEVSVWPSFVGFDRAVRLRCRVPQDPENRKLRWGFEFHRNSETSLSGANEKITWERVITEIPCDPGPAYCETTRASGSKSRVVLDVRVLGCGADEDDQPINP